jgi:hypothetical protein
MTDTFRDLLARPEPPERTDFRALCAELADELESWISGGYEADIDNAHALIERARADMAEQPRGFTPIPVAERLPGPEDCDAEGRCWAWNAGSCGWWEWVDSKMIPYSHDDFTHWLPANALPVPAND